jgi:hypothetical protein
MENMSLSDIAAVTKDNDNWGGAGGWIWIIVLFLFMYGNGWNRNTTTEQPVTEAGLCNAMNMRCKGVCGASAVIERRFAATI